MMLAKISTPFLLLLLAALYNPAAAQCVWQGYFYPSHLLYAFSFPEYRLLQAPLQPALVNAHQPILNGLQWARAVAIMVSPIYICSYSLNFSRII